jgi:hypothetical protein
VKQQQCESEQFIEISNDLKRFSRSFYIRWKEGEREQDSGETERESVFTRGRVLQQEEDRVGNKIDC